MTYFHSHPNIVTQKQRERTLHRNLDKPLKLTFSKLRRPQPDTVEIFLHTRIQISKRSNEKADPPVDPRIQSIPSIAHNPAAPPRTFTKYGQLSTIRS